MQIISAMTTDSAPHDVPTLITALGGVTRLATALGLPLGTVSAWKTRRSIPVDQWQKIIEIAKGPAHLLAIDANLLLALHKPPPRPGADDVQGAAA